MPKPVVLLFTIILLTFLFCKGQPAKQLFGSRPVINLSSINNEAFEQGKISLKLKSNYASIIKNISIKNGIVFFNVASVDKINKQLGAYNFDYTFLLKKITPTHIKYGLNLWVDIKVPNTVNIKQAINLYTTTNIFDVVEPLYKIATCNTIQNTNYIPNDVKLAEQWNIKNTGQANGTVGKDMKVTEAWDIEKGKPNVIVAIMDRGIDANHQDLGKNIWVNKGYNFVTNTTIINPEDHGTSSAGIIGAITNNAIGISGIAGGDGSLNSGIRLMSCQILDGASSGNIAQAFIYAADNGACISNNSWIFTTPGAYRVSVLDAIDYFCNNAGGNVLNGGVVICAAANSSDERLTYPACYERVIGVTATNNKDQKSGFASFGNWVDIAAPAGDGTGTPTDIATTITNNNYAYASGTSACAPQVSGVAALLVSKMAGKASANDIREILLSTTDDINTINPTYIGKMGAGRVNAFKALQKAENLLNTYVVNSVQKFEAMYNCNSITLSWQKNINGNNVIIAYNDALITNYLTNNTYYSVGDVLANNVKIIYKGSATSFTLPILNDSLFHYFSIWSVDANNQYSFAKQYAVETGPNIKLLENKLYEENFEAPTIPNKYLRIINKDSNITWAKTIDAKYEGNSALYINNYSYTNIGQTDTLLLPDVQADNADSIIINFKLAYQFLSKADSLEILASTNCGKNYTSLWKKGGKELATTTNPSTAAFIPTLSEWKTETVSIGINAPLEKIKIAFNAINANGQNLFLDNIKLFTKKLPTKLKQNGFLISPSPFIQSFFVQHYQIPTTLKAIMVFDINGKKIVEKKFTANAASNIEISISNFANGYYFVHLIYTDKKIAKKILKLAN